MERSAADETMGSADCRIIFTPHTVETKRFFSPSVLFLHHVYSLQRHLFVRRLSFDEHLRTFRSVPQHKFPLFQQEWRMAITMPRTRVWLPMLCFFFFFLHSTTAAAEDSILRQNASILRSFLKVSLY